MLQHHSIKVYLTVKYFGREKLGKFGAICQVIFDNIPNEARGHAICVVNI